MQRRDFLKQAGVAAVYGAVLPQVMGSSGRSYDSATISARVAEETPGVTSVYLTEHGEADQAIVEAFYWTTIQHDGKETRVMLHKEATTPLSHGTTFVTELPLPVASIAFLRVKEMKMLNQSEFGHADENL